MNQILVTDVENNNQFNEKKKGTKFLWFLLIVMLLAILGCFIYLFASNSGNNGFFNNNLLSGFTDLKNQIIKKKNNQDDILISNNANDKTDKTKPTITIENKNGKLLVISKDDSSLEYFSYQWEGEEEQVTKPTEEDPTTIEQEIEVQKGTKQLTLTAVDKFGNMQVLNKKIIGSNGPEIKVSLSNGNFVVNVSDEFGITKIVYTHNQVEHTVEDIPQGAKEFEFNVPVTEGDNYLKINAYENSIMTEYKCKKTK